MHLYTTKYLLGHGFTVQQAHLLLIAMTATAGKIFINGQSNNCINAELPSVKAIVQCTFWFSEKLLKQMFDKEWSKHSKQQHNCTC